MRCAGPSRGFTTPPPDQRAGYGKRERQPAEEREDHQIERYRVEFEPAVKGRSGLDGDHALGAGQPVQDVDAEIQIAAIAEKAVGEKFAAADDHHPLFAITHRALESLRDRHGPRYVARLVERDLTVELRRFDPTARRDIDERRHAP